MANRLGPSSESALIEAFNSGDYFSFFVSRHPFDRLLSGYRDRIQRDPCTGQAKLVVPQIYQKLKLPGA